MSDFWDEDYLDRLQSLKRKHIEIRNSIELGRPFEALLDIEQFSEQISQNQDMHWRYELTRFVFSGENFSCGTYATIVYAKERIKYIPQRDTVSYVIRDVLELREVAIWTEKEGWKDVE